MMALKHEIRRLIDLLPPRDPAEAMRIHNRWLRLSGLDAPEPDYLPIIVQGFDRAHPEEYQRDLFGSGTRYPLAEQVEDPEKMLYEQLLRLVPLRRYPGDGTPVVMPFFGNAFLLSALGLETRVEGDLLEPARSLSLDEVRRLEMLPNWAEAGHIGQAVRFVQYARSILPPHIPVGLCFMMSPYDLAYLVRGSEMMLEGYDAPADLHRLMRLCAELFVQATRLLKREAGEPDGFHRYINATHAGSALSCEDCCVMLSPKLHREFGIPYTRQAFQELGGGWVHFCGDGRRILDDYLAIPDLHGILYGQLHLNGVPHETALKLIRHGKGLNYGVGGPDYVLPEPPGSAPQRAPGEPWPAYFRRILAPFSRRKGIFVGAGAFTDEPGVGESLQRMWHDAQDETFGGRSAS